MPYKTDAKVSKLVHGFDCSSFQGAINWDKVATTDKKFVAIKATEGTLYKDPSFQSNWRGAKHAALLRLAYHFFRPESDGYDQASAFHKYVHDSGGMHGNDAVMLDFETFDGVPAAQTQDGLARFIYYCLHTMKRQVCIYTGKYVWDTLGNPKNPLFTDRPLWIAAYQDKAPSTLPGFPVLSFWQYSESGHIAGIRGEVDLDVFFGDMEQLKAVLRPPV